MAPGARSGRPSSRARNKWKKRLAAWPVGSVFSKVGGFAALHTLLRLRKERCRKLGGGTAGLVDATATAQVDKPCGGGMLVYSRNSQPTEDKEVKKQDPWEWAQMKFETGATRNSWSDPDAKFCCICGDEEDQHVELMCPYNYLSPAAYVPCRARFVVWNNEIIRYKCWKQKSASRQDGIISRRRKFLRCFIRVNNLPECCLPEQFVRLFTEFGPLWMYHVAMRSSEICGGFGYVVFKHHEHAKEAIEKLNCYNVNGRKLRVDWAYPSA
ncbi:uncharacterized protein LOC133904032 [Phragmites australis]|uniref:uncharacterized protein LOC133904032 n=1 Tax=Phragmites australis TaxID=29695 RepID=UPI002D7672D9|nr:uncharacterized protein LOC133904032 [Phragmites australis]